MPSFSLLILSLIAGADIAATASEPDERGPIVSLSTTSCNLRSARQIELASAIRDYRDLRGRCIAVRGWNRGISLYRSRGEAQARASLATANAPARMGIYGDDAALAALSSEPREVVAAGIVGACEVINQGEGASGYCHSVSEGGFLILGQIRPQT